MNLFPKQIPYWIGSQLELLWVSQPCNRYSLTDSSKRNAHATQKKWHESWNFGAHRSFSILNHPAFHAPKSGAAANEALGSPKRPASRSVGIKSRSRSGSLRRDAGHWMSVIAWRKAVPLGFGSVFVGGKEGMCDWFPIWHGRIGGKYLMILNGMYIIGS